MAFTMTIDSENIDAANAHHRIEEVVTSGSTMSFFLRAYPNAGSSACLWWARYTNVPYDSGGAAAASQAETWIRAMPAFSSAVDA